MGDKTFFWKDQWLQGATIIDIAPLVVATVCIQVANRRLVRDAMCMHAWMSDVVGDLCTEGLTQFIAFWEIISEV